MKDLKKFVVSNFFGPKAWVFQVWIRGPLTETCSVTQKIQVQRGKVRKLAWSSKSPASNRNRPTAINFVLKMNQDIFFHVIWLKCTFDIYIFLLCCCVVCHKAMLYEHSRETFLLWFNFVILGWITPIDWCNAEFTWRPVLALIRSPVYKSLELIR